jgi:hypothetical protein
MQFILYFLHSGHKTCFNVTVYKSCYGSIKLGRSKATTPTTIQYVTKDLAINVTRIQNNRSIKNWPKRIFHKNREIRNKNCFKKKVS